MSHTQRYTVKPIKLTMFEPSQYRLWADLAKSTFTIHKVFDIADSSSPNPSTAEGFNSENPHAPEYLALPPQQRKAMTFSLVKPLSKLSSQRTTSSGTLTYASQIWIPYYQRYGQIYDVKRAVAAYELHAPVHLPLRAWRSTSTPLSAWL